MLSARLLDLIDKLQLYCGIAIRCYLDNIFFFFPPVILAYLSDWQLFLSERLTMPRFFSFSSICIIILKNSLLIDVFHLRGQKEKRNRLGK